MTAAVDKYARVYHGVVDDLKFETIYPDDHHFAAWVRLLLIADAAWPMNPPIPRTVRKASLFALVRSGLVDLLPQDCYRIHGLASERTRRTDSARNAAAKRWDSERNAGAMLAHEPPASIRNADAVLPDQTIAKQTRPEHEQTSAPALASSDDPIHDAHRWLALHRCHVKPGGQADIQLARMVDMHGIEAVVKAWESMPTQTDGAQYVFGARNILSPLPGAKVVGGQEQREAEASDRHAKQLARTQRLLAEQRGERTAEA